MIVLIVVVAVVVVAVAILVCSVSCAVMIVESVVCGGVVANDIEQLHTSAVGELVLKHPYSWCLVSSGC